MAPDRVSELLLGLAITACTSSAPQPATDSAAPFPVRIAAHAEDQRPVTNVTLLAGTQVLGRTNEQGRVELALHGDEGERATLAVRCPDGFASPERPLVVGLRHLSAGSEAPKFEVECVRLVHSVLVGILAENGPHLPILHLKKKIGETDDHGVAHVLLPASNDERFTLTLDTSSNQNLRPQNPSLGFVTRDHDEFVLLEHKFVVNRPAPAPHARRRGPQPL